MAAATTLRCPFLSRRLAAVACRPAMTYGVNAASRRLRGFASTDSSGTDWSHVKQELLSRKIPTIYDHLVPTPSHLLNVALAGTGVLPSSGAAAGTPAAAPTRQSLKPLPTTTEALPLPPAHHLVYFPPAIPAADLLPDGTDPLQSPGEPFVRRMWAGGSLTLRNDSAAPKVLTLNGGRAACTESIVDVAVKGRPGDEKIFVAIERRVGRCVDETESDESVRRRLGVSLGDGEVAGSSESNANNALADSALIERRNLVFMRERSREQAQRDAQAAATRLLMPPTSEAGIVASFEHTVVADATLLFRYSALTYNAHSIHLDVAYCRDVEGHRGLLTHGPLSFTLIVTALRRYLAAHQPDQALAHIEYRCLAPLYAGEPMRVAGLDKGDGRFSVWIETPEGGVAVRATARTEPAVAQAT